jgi:lipoprotein-anchoring transpeptidase ErfK/SrfK
VLVSYEGDRPVFATLVSTGKNDTFRTPQGVFRVARKQALARMRSPTGAVEEWNVENVPWVMHFKKLFALHGAHWHDAYGKKFSHGCVNMSPRDAGLLFRWTSPAVPDGWADLEDSEDPGTAIRIRSRHRADPPWRDFEGTVIAPPAR